MTEDEYSQTLPPSDPNYPPPSPFLTLSPEQSYPREDEPTNEEIQQALLNFVIRVVPPPPKPLLERLNPQKSPGDKALALSLRMVKQRQERQVNQLKILADLRSSRISKQINPIQQDIFKAIEKQNYMKRHNYLREEHYSTLTPRPKRFNQSVVLPKLSLLNQKKTIKREAQVLERYRRLNLRHEAKKIILDLLYQVIGRSVEVYHRKHNYFKKGTPKKVSQMLGESLLRSRTKNRKGSLTLSRVVEIAINQQEIEEDVEEGEGSHEDEEGSAGSQAEGSEGSQEEDSHESSDDEDFSEQQLQEEKESHPLVQVKLKEGGQSPNQWQSESRD